MTGFRHGVATSTGRVRQVNEDSYLAQPPLYAIADGMGGHGAGDLASALAIETLTGCARLGPLSVPAVLATLDAANQAIAGHEPAGMGTTVTGLASLEAAGGDHLMVFNVGDSRVYRCIDDRLTLVTVDHSEVRELVDAGFITEEEAAHHPLRNVVTRSLGTETAPTPDVWVLPPHSGERFVICSDGLSNELGADEIRRLLTGSDDPQQAADALVAAAVEAGGRDNVSVIVVDLDADEREQDLDADTSP